MKDLPEGYTLVEPLTDPKPEVATKRTTRLPGALPELPEGYTSAPLNTPTTTTPSTTRTWGEAASDVGRAFMSGAAGLVRTGGDLYGIASGNVDNLASELGRNAQEYWQEGQSDALKAQKQARSEVIDAADGVLAQTGTAIWETLKRPALLADVAAENAMTMLPAGAAGRGAAVLTRAPVARKLTAELGENLAARNASPALAQRAARMLVDRTADKVATRTGLGAAIGTGAVQQGTDVARSAYDAALESPNWDQNPDYVQRVNAGENPDAVKHEMALDAARVTFPTAVGISAASQALPGATILERALVGGAARNTRAVSGPISRALSAARGALGEGTQEAIEEGGGQFAGNVVRQQMLDPTVDLGEDVGENAGIGFVGGAALGGPAGFAHGTRNSQERIVGTPDQTSTTNQNTQRQADGAPTANQTIGNPADQPPPAPPALNPTTVTAAEITTRAQTALDALNAKAMAGTITEREVANRNWLHDNIANPQALAAKQKLRLVEDEPVPDARAGETAEAEPAAPTIPWFNAETGELREATDDEVKDQFLRMFEFASNAGRGRAGTAASKSLAEGWGIDHARLKKLRSEAVAEKKAGITPENRAQQQELGSDEDMARLDEALGTAPQAEAPPAQETPRQRQAREDAEGVEQDEAALRAVGSEAPATPTERQEPVSNADELPAAVPMQDAPPATPPASAAAAAAQVQPANESPAPAAPAPDRGAEPAQAQEAAGEVAGARSPGQPTTRAAIRAVPDSAFNGDLENSLQGVFDSEEYAGAPVPLVNRGFTSEEVEALQRAGLADTDGQMSVAQFGAWMAERSERLSGRRQKAPRPDRTAEIRAARIKRLRDREASGAISEGEREELGRLDGSTSSLPTHNFKTPDGADATVAVIAGGNQHDPGKSGFRVTNRMVNGSVVTPTRVVGRYNTLEEATRAANEERARLSGEERGAETAAERPSAPPATGAEGKADDRTAPATLEAIAERHNANHNERYPDHPADTARQSGRADAVARAIVNKDVDALRNMNIGDAKAMPALRKTFEQVTGIKLPMGKRASLAAVDEWAGVTPEQRAEKTRAKDAKRAAEQNERAAKGAEHAAANLPVSVDGKESTGKAFVDDLIARGFTRLRAQKRGAATRYYLANAEGKGYSLPHRALYEYARVAADRAANEAPAVVKEAATPGAAPKPTESAAPSGSAPLQPGTAQSSPAAAQDSPAVPASPTVDAKAQSRPERTRPTTPPAEQPAAGNAPLATGDAITITSGKHKGKAGTVFRAGKLSVGVQFADGTQASLSPKVVEKAAAPSVPAVVFAARLTPAKAQLLQEAHRALGGDVTYAQVKQLRDRVAAEVESGFTNNGGVRVRLRPAAVEQRRGKLRRLDHDLALFEAPATADTKPRAPRFQKTDEIKDALRAHARAGTLESDAVIPLMAEADRRLGEAGMDSLNAELERLEAGLPAEPPEAPTQSERDALAAKPAHSADRVEGNKKAVSIPRDTVEPASAENTRERITPDTAAKMRSGDIVVDEQGNEYRAHAARHDWLEAHPIINGRAEVNADSRVMFLLTPSKAGLYPSRRNVPIYATGRNIHDQPDTTSKGKPSATGDAITITSGKYAGKAGTVFRAGKTSIGVELEDGTRASLSPKVVAKATVVNSSLTTDTGPSEAKPAATTEDRPDGSDTRPGVETVRGMGEAAPEPADGVGADRAARAGGEVARKAAWELSRDEWVDQEIRTSRYADRYERDPEASARRADQLGTTWLEGLRTRAAEGRIAKEALDDLVARDGEEALRQFRGTLAPGVDGYELASLRLWDKTYRQVLAMRDRGELTGVGKSDNLKDLHRTALARAQADGHEIPTNILSDYPELARASESVADAGADRPSTSAITRAATFTDTKSGDLFIDLPAEQRDDMAADLRALGIPFKARKDGFRVPKRSAASAREQIAVSKETLGAGGRLDTFADGHVQLVTREATERAASREEALANYRRTYDDARADALEGHGAADGGAPRGQTTAGAAEGATNADQEQAPEQAAPDDAAATARTLKDGSKAIGRRQDGKMIYEDNAGVRYYADRGARISETVSLRPTRQGMVVERLALKPEFMTAEEMAAEQKPSAAPSKTKPPVSENKVFTEDAAAKARAILKAKLGQLNTGIDPEILQAGITLAGYHIEKGARTFVAFANAMVADLGEAVRPYLKSWYMGVKYDPRAAAFEGMDSATVVEAADVAAPKVVDSPKGEKAENTDGSNGSVVEDSQALAGVPAGRNAAPEGEQDVGGGDAGRGAGGDGRNRAADGAGVSGARGGRSGVGEPRVPEARTRRRAVAGTAGRTGRDGSGVSAQPAGDLTPAAPNIPARNFTITDELNLGQGGEVAKFNDNLAAIRILKTLEAENRRATADEQAALARYVGWGGLANAFAVKGEFKTGWEARGAELEALLTPKELAAARRSTRNAHYTSQPVVEGMWTAMQRLGFAGGSVLEPSMGTGNFLGLTPEALRGSTRFVGIELDSLTSRIAGALYPNETILASGLQKVPLAEGSFDAAIGNPPFGQESLTFQFSPELNGQSIHNQFFLASMDALKPNGVLAMVVSRYLLDRKDASARRMLADRGELLGAIRLPDTAFKTNARTEVVTDVIFMRKYTVAEMAARAAEREKAAKEKRAVDYPGWVETTTVPDPLGGDAIEVNRHFADNPHMVLGTLERSGSMMHGNDVTVRADGDLAEALDAAIARLPKQVVHSTPDAVQASLDRHAKMAESLRLALSGAEAGAVSVQPDGTLQQVIERETPTGDYELTVRTLTPDSPWSSSLYMDSEGRWFRLVEQVGEDGKKVKQTDKKGKPTRLNAITREVFADDAAVPARLKLGAQAHERLLALAKLRDLLKHQLVLEAEDAPAAQLEGNRESLATAYKAFQAAHGYVNDPGNARLMADMPDGALVLALESGYRAGTKNNPSSAKPAPILAARVVLPYAPPQTAASPADALAITMAESGKVDLARIASLLGKDEAAVVAELHDAMDAPLIFRDPEGNQWMPRAQYLTGLVRRKLEAARAAGLDKNIAALEQVQPEPWGAENVSVGLGAGWVPPDVYAAFAKHLMGGDASVHYSALTNTFGLDVRGTNRASRDEWGTDDVSPQELLSDLLNSKSTTIRHRDSDGKTWIDQEATALAQIKRKAITDEFADWVFSDSARREQLVELFNDKFNTRVARQHDGSHLVLPGKVPDAVIAMRRHQNNVIWRGISERFLLMDHVVGAGKTFSAIARAMERRRMGLARKPMVAVPNHLVEQWASDVFRLYPGAKVLAAGKKDFEKSRRRRLFAKIATGDWDIVIVPHSSFGFIGIAPETEERYLTQEIERAQAAIHEAQEAAEEEGAGGWGKPVGVKEAERLLEKLEQRLAKIQSAHQDKLLNFEQLGVDDLTVDEAHEFKNLFYSSRLTGVRGMGDKQGSRKAFDLYNKVRVLRESPTGAVTFLTGTPISNSAVEMYTMMRYLAADELADAGLENFDAWRSQYVDAEPAFEPTETGSLKEVTRLGRSWSNMRALMELYGSFTDSVTAEDIALWYAEDNKDADGKPKRFPVPDMVGGARRSVVIKPTAAQIEILNDVIAGFDGLAGIKDRMERNAARLRLMDRARKVALDARAAGGKTADNEAGGKLQTIADEVSALYKKWDADKGTQLVFLDRSVPKAKGDDRIVKDYDALKKRADAALEEGNDDAYMALQEKLEKFDANEIEELRAAQNGGWNAYQQLKDNLIARGISADEIRFVQEATNDAQKKALFDAVNAGEVRVLIGSTPRMGAGTNVQERLVGLHHADVTWKPSDIEQREGRIIRQGNKLLEKYGHDRFKVVVNAYATERTIDAKMWDLNSQKLKTINAIRKYGGEFTMDFEDEAAVGMAEMAALASGDPLLMERVKLASQIDKLQLAQRAHRRKMYGIESRISDAERTIRDVPKRIAELEENEKRMATARDAALKRASERATTVEGTQHARLPDAMRALKEAIDRQKGGDNRAKFSVEVAGKRYTAVAAAENAVTEAFGDVDTFEAVIDGTTAIRRSDAVNRVEQALPKDELVDGKPLGEMYGFKLVADVTPPVFGMDGNLVTLSLLNDDGSTLASFDGEHAPTAIRKMLSGLSDAVMLPLSREHVRSLQGKVARAREDLPRLQEQRGKPFPEAEELAAKNARLEEVVRTLAADKAGVSKPAAGGTATNGGTVAAAASDSAAHPDSATPATPAQQEAGNHKMGHVNLHGLDVTIEVPKGGLRRGTAKDGTAWERAASDHYGYIKRTEAADGEQFDVYLGPLAEAADAKVFVIDQVRPGTNIHDESKAMIGFATGREARASYAANFPKDLQVFGGIREMSMDEFKAWLKEDATRPATDKVQVAGGNRANASSTAAAGNAPLFSRTDRRSGSTRRGTPLGEKKDRAIKAIAVRILGVDAAKARLIVVDDTGGLPEKVRQHMAEEGIPAAEVRGVHWRGKTYLVAAGLTSVQDVTAAIYHEDFTHFGLRARYGNRLGGELKRLLRGVGGLDGLRGLAKEQGIDLAHYETTLASSASVADAHKPLVLMEELLAHLGETSGTLRRIIQEWVGALRRWLRANRFAELADYGVTDLADVLRQARLAAMAVDGRPRNQRAMPFFQRAWHGTPHRGIEQEGFKLVKIGTGEGAQAYGWGIYFAGNRDVGEGYRKALSRSFRGWNPSKEAEALGIVNFDDGEFRRAFHAHAMSNAPTGVAAKRIHNASADARKVDGATLSKLVERFREFYHDGQIYHAEIPENHELLDWDKPLGEQPKKVRDAVVGRSVNENGNGSFSPTVKLADGKEVVLDITYQSRKAAELYNDAADEGRHTDQFGERLYGALTRDLGSPQAASEYLNSIGIPGLRYLDGSSRGDGEGTHNYVIWDEARLSNDVTPYYSRRAVEDDGLSAAGRQQARSTAPTTSALTAAIHEATRTWGSNMPRVRVLATAAEYPAHLKERWERSDYARPLWRKSQGYNDTAGGTVYVVAGNVRSVKHGMQILAHEMVGHYGVDKIIDERIPGGWQTVVGSVARLRVDPSKASQKMQAVLREAERRYSTASPEVFAREVIAIAAEHGVRNSWVNQAIAAVRAWLRQHFPGLNLNSAELLSLLTHSEAFLRDNNPAVDARRAAAGAMSFSDQAPPFYSALLQAVQAGKGAPRKAAATAWKQWLDGAQRRGEIKQAERDWLGVDVWLDGRENTTREDLADFVRANQVQVQDVVLGDRTPNPERLALNTEKKALKNRLAGNSSVREGDRRISLGQVGTRGSYTLWGARKYVAERNSEGVLVWKRDGTFGDSSSGRVMSRRLRDQLTASAQEAGIPIENVAHNQPIVGVPLPEQREIEARLREIDKELSANHQKQRPTKFGQWQLPGGKKYRELLLTLPTTGQSANVSLEWEQTTDDMQTAQLPSGRIATVIYDSQAPENGATLDINDPDGEGGAGGMSYPSVDAAKAAAAGLAEQRQENVVAFRSKHFDQPNILAHVRFNERTDVDGKRVLFVEEIQSDWHQAGRKHGYARADRPDAELLKLLEDAGYTASHNGTNWVVTSKDGSPVPNKLAGSSAPSQFAANLAQVAQMVLGRQDLRAALRAVPNAPLKNTDEWAMLAFKRMVRHAAENGFDRIAWTTGEQQAERYDLSKQIDRIAITKTGGVWAVNAWKDGTKAITKDAPTDADLAALVGKELAERAIKDGGGDYSGLDLKVGGEGMRGFYDRILPKVVAKWAKSFGAKVGETQIDTGGDTATVHSIDVTPAMHDAALDGLPLFAFSFAGARAVTADLSKLDEARQREAIGRDSVPLRDGRVMGSPSDTHQATGWHKGVDGRWRWEIDDSGAKVRMGWLAAARTGGTTLDQVLDHRDLFGAYPHLADVKVVIQPGLKAYGSYDERTNTLTLRGGTAAYPATGPKSLRSLILHETQHAIQGIEGFARGGNIEGVKTMAEYQRVLASVNAKGLTDAELRAAYAVYHRLAGEVEARNTQRRAGMTAEQRQRFTPGMTQDVPRGNQIVRGTGALSASEDGTFSQPAGYDFRDSDYRAPVLAWAKNRFGDLVAPNGKAAWQNFVRWFGDSKVVDENGAPLVVYHGTTRTFTTFQKGDAPGFGEGIYFTDNRTQAETEFADDGRGRVVEAYLAIKNPFRPEEGMPPFADLEATKAWERASRRYERVEDAWEDDGSFVGAALRELDYDGIISKNSNNIEGLEIVAFEPSQIKSATENTGDFDADNANIQFSLADPTAATEQIEEAIANPDGALFERAKAWLRGKGENLVPAALQGLQRRHLTELMEGHRALKTYGKQYDERVQQMEADRGQLIAGAPDAAEHPDDMLKRGAATIADALEKFARPPGLAGWFGRRNPEYIALAKVMHSATIEGMDPSEEYQRLLMEDGKGNYMPWTAAAVKERLRAINVLIRSVPGGDKRDLIDRYKVLKGLDKREKAREAKWPGLLAAYQALSPEAKALYKQQRDWHSQMRDEVEKGLIARVEAIGRDMVANGADDMARRYMRQAIQRIRLQFETNRLEGVYFPLNRDGDFWVAIERAGEEGFKMFETAEAAHAAMKSLRKAGYTITASGRRDGNFRARNAPSGTFVGEIIKALKAARVPEKVQDEVYQVFLRSLPEMSMRKHSIHRKKTAGFDPEVLRGFSKTAYHGSYQLARLRHAHELGSILEAAEFAMRNYREASPGRDAPDILDVARGDALLGELKRRHDFIMSPEDNSTANVLNSVGFVYFLGATPAAALVNLTQNAQVTLPVLGAHHGWAKASRMLGAAVRDSLRTGGNIDRTFTTDEDRHAYKTLRARGDIDKTQSHTLAALSEGNTLKSSPAWSRAMEIVSFLFHKAEVVNREAAGMAAFRLARSRGDDFNAAVQYASDIINGTHFDYSAANRPRIMQGNAMRVATQFKSYSVGMTWMLGRNLHQAIRGESPEVRKASRQILAGVLGMTSLMAGVVGLPIINLVKVVAMAAHAAFGDDDEPWEFDVEFRQWLADNLGPEAAKWVADGPINQLTGAALSTRVSLSNLWFRDADRELEGAAAYYDMLEDMIGPIGGLTKNMFVGTQRISDGQVWRGVETMLPKFAKDAMKATRFATDGANTLRGDPIVDDISGPQALMQAIGFQPTVLFEQRKVTNALKNYEQNIQDRRQSLMNAFALATRAGEPTTDVMARIQAFNTKYPEIPISATTIRQSMRARARYSSQAEGGVVVNRKLRERLGEMTGVGQ